MFASPVLEELRGLDPERDHERIVFLTTRVDFPFDTVRALELALFRTYCSPRISALLDRTGEFARRAQKRYDDTDLLVSELMDHGYSSARGKAALRRMNGIHGRFEIANEDFLYVLSTFVFEPLRWIGRYGWRRLLPQEEEGMFVFFREVGRRMGIREIPPTRAAFEAFSRAYEQEQFRFAESNQRVGMATVELFMSWLPRLVRPFARPCVVALLDEPMLEAFGFPKPARLLRGLTHGALRARALGLRWWPRRRTPFLRTAQRSRTYPQGYRLEELGPPLPQPTPGGDR